MFLGDGAALSTRIGTVPLFTSQLSSTSLSQALRNSMPLLNVAAANSQAAAQRQAAANALPITLGPAPTTDWTRWALYGGVAVAGFFVLRSLFKGGSSAPAALPVKTNPRRRRNPSRVPILTRSERLKKAVDAYEGFHWGDEPERIVRKKVSKAPRVGVKLGKLVSVAYETHKGGERAVWEHEFGEEGGKRPDLVMDADNKRLHIVGGTYDVRNEGIID